MSKMEELFQEQRRILTSNVNLSANTKPMPQVSSYETNSTSDKTKMHPNTPTDVQDVDF